MAEQAFDIPSSLAFSAKLLHQLATFISSVRSTETQLAHVSFSLRSTNKILTGLDGILKGSQDDGGGKDLDSAVSVGKVDGGVDVRRRAGSGDEGKNKGDATGKVREKFCHF